MSDHHIPVLLNEVIESFSNLAGRKDLHYFDGTYGRGGHAKALDERYHFLKISAVDQDLQAVAQAEKFWSEEIKSGRFQIQHINFSERSQTFKENEFDAILLDLGVSSPQLDEAARGFSFNKDGPLDMRMNQKAKMTAAELINSYESEDLIQIFKEFGEVEKPERVVRAVVNDRITKPFTTTLQLAQLIERVDGWRKKGFHPATQYFMALRLVVNRELEGLVEALPRLRQSLKLGGRLAIITFHSLEDRIVKTDFIESTEGFPVHKKVIVASDDECQNNPRARSAKLRIFQKGPAPEKPDKFALRRALRARQETGSTDEEQ